MNKETKAILSSSLKNAKKVLAKRNKIVDKKNKRRQNRGAQMSSPKISPQLSGRMERMAKKGADFKGVLIAEGDSWFDYPGDDILSILEDEYDYDVKSVARKGDEIQEMAFQGNQLERFVRKLEKCIRRSEIPDAILLSGGGNDVSGAHFETFLNHADSIKPGLNLTVTQEVINHRIREAYLHIISMITHVCEDRLGRKIPIIIHGYDYAVPDGRGFKFGFFTFSGPWLEPGFDAKGYTDINIKRKIVKQLIDMLNDVLTGIPIIRGFNHVKYVDLRNTLPNASSSYKKWWDNELHPTDKGFERVAKKIVQQI
ncbi:MAG: hypothetical protein AAF402_03305 [Pseudomonadota bacterium]